MGTWGTESFENDAAGDFLWEVEESEDLSVLKSALNPGLAEGYEDFLDKDGDMLEAPNGEIIVAASEIINAMVNGGRYELPEELQSWINKHKNLDAKPLIPKAIEMLDLVLSDNSELNILWSENETDFLTWKNGVLDLRRRLKG